MRIRTKGEQKKCLFRGTFKCIKIHFLFKYTFWLKAKVIAARQMVFDAVMQPRKGVLCVFPMEVAIDHTRDIICMEQLGKWIVFPLFRKGRKVGHHTENFQPLLLGGIQRKL